MRILIFGGSGFLGSYVADELSARGHAVSIFDRQQSAYLGKNQRMILGDILDADQVRAALKAARAEAVYNFAGLADLNVSIVKPLETVQLNILGNTYILEACRAEAVKRFIYASSVYALSSKGSFYGISKHACEKIVEEYGRRFKLSYTIVRYGSVYGSRADDQNRIYRLIRQALSEKKITFNGDGAEEREYIHGKDAAKLSADILAKSYAGQHLMLTGVERFKYSELLNMIKEMLDGSVKVEFLNKDYEGHYVFTPYAFTSTHSKKLTANPFIDMGQGLLEVMSSVARHLEQGKKK